MTNADISTFSALAPLLIVKDIRKTVSYYTNVLGFTHIASGEDDKGRPTHAEVVFPQGRVEGTQPQGPFMVMLMGTDAMTSPDKTWTRNTKAGPHGRGVINYVYVDNVDAYHAAIEAAGGAIVEPLTQQPWGDRTFSVSDPDGYRWTFATVSL